MRIVQVVNHYAPCLGGVERVAMDISAGLAERGHKVKVVCLDRCANSQKKLPETETINGIRVDRIPFLNLHYYKIAPTVLDKVKDSDIVHVHGLGFFSDFLLLTKWLYKKPVLVSTHGGVFHTKDIGFLKKIYFSHIQKFLLNRSDRVIAVSQNDLKKFSEITENISLIENGVDTKKFSIGKKRKNSFLFVGRFSKNKRIELLLEAFARVKRDFSLIIAGNDWENLLQDYWKRVSALGLEKKVLFMQNPSDEELKELYASSEFFVSASRYEGFGLALVEAMASGCIPIVHSNEGFTGITREKRFFTDYKDASGAATALENALSLKGNEKKALMEKALRGSGPFDWGQRITALEKLYRKTPE